MYRMFAAMLLSSVALADSPAGYDEPFKEADLLALCTGAPAQVAECDRYIAGARGGMMAQRLFMGYIHGSQKHDPDPLTKKLLTREPFCDIPKDTTPTEIRKVVVEFMQNDKGKNSHAAASFTVLMALSVKYGCNKSEPN